MDNQTFQKLVIDKFNKAQEFQQYVIDQFSIVATKDDLKGFVTKDDLKNFVTKDDLKGFATKEDISLIYLNMATKTELAEVKEIVMRLDKRSDEDMRATMKDVEKIKGVLGQQGYNI